jgi:pimeloyl-ACP methyl ester carboxylesterase
MRVVLLHSALGDSRLWQRQIDGLSPHHEVVAPDLPGFGGTPMPREEFSFVDAVTPHLPGALVGNSFGGMVALRTACAHPELVQRLVLIGSGVPEWQFTEEMRDYWAAEEAAVTRNDLDGATQVGLDFWVAPELHDEVRPQLLRALQLQTLHEEPPLRWPEAFVPSELDLPVLVVVGSEDKPDFVKIAEHLATEIPGAELAVVKGAGHLVGLDRPEELNALLLEFLSEDAGVPE